jgi:hypothetical protein
MLHILNYVVGDYGSLWIEDKREMVVRDEFYSD